MTDRERLIELLMQGELEASKQGVFNCFMCNREAEILADFLLENGVGVIVPPVKYGEWCGTVCSACGESTSFYYDCDYCPCCGAKMDGG